MILPNFNFTEFYCTLNGSLIQVKKDEVKFFQSRTFKGETFSVRRTMQHRFLTFVNDLLSFHSKEQISTDTYLSYFQNYSWETVITFTPKSSILSVRNMRLHANFPQDTLLLLQVWLSYFCKYLRSVISSFLIPHFFAQKKKKKKKKRKKRRRLKACNFIEKSDPGVCFPVIFFLWKFLWKSEEISIAPGERKGAT